MKKFYIFGKGISFSMSPTIHTAGYRHYGLPHTYTIVENEGVDGFAHLVRSPQFGGASVTMPHKLAVDRLCDEVTDHAKRIGAINTLRVVGEDGSQDASETWGAHRTRRRRIVGDNTDWSGLVAAIRRKTPFLSQVPNVGLVIGAGGASRAALYALHQLGVGHIYLVNRTRSTAEAIAKDFSPIFSIKVLSSLADIHAVCAPHVVIGTITADKTDDNCFPLALFSQPQGICVDMAYKPRGTPLLTVAKMNSGWQPISGVEVLLEQAFDQFRLWTGLPAPQVVMKDALLSHDRRIAEAVEGAQKRVD